MYGKHKRDMEPDYASTARCPFKLTVRQCHHKKPRTLYCPAHMPAAYARFEARHRKATA